MQDQLNESNYIYSDQEYRQALRNFSKSERIDCLVQSIVSPTEEATSTSTNDNV